MPKLIPVGALVRVLPSALNAYAEFSKVNIETTSIHGWLYFVEGNKNVDPVSVTRSDPYSCRSLATGQSGLSWLPNEIEEAPTDDGV